MSPYLHATRLFLVCAGLTHTLIPSSLFAGPQDSIAERQAALEELLLQGKLSETLSGYLKEVSPLAPDAHSLMTAENADREALYRAIATAEGKNPADPAAAGSERARRYSTKLKPGILREVVDASGQPRIWDGRDPDPRQASSAVRVVTIDGAAIHQQPSTDSAKVRENLPRFSAYSVVSEQNGWYQVTNRSPEVSVEPGSALGWISADKCFPWNHAIVAKATPLYRRDPAVFFKDKEVLKQIAALPDPETRKSRMQALTSEDGVVAREPNVDFATQGRAFIVPVIDHEDIEVDGRPSLLVELGAQTGAGEQSKERVEPPLDVVFVMDTTGSMGPYTEEVINQVRRMAEQLAEQIPKVNFGFIGYRDDEGKDPLMEYRTRNFTPKLLPIEDFTQAIGEVTAVEKPLKDEIAEAMYHGVDEAISCNWRAKLSEGMRVVVVIGDAPAHETELKEGLFATSLRERAAANQVKMFSIFLKNGKNSTKETDKLAITQLTELTRTAELGTASQGAPSMLQIIDAKDVRGFGKAFSETFAYTEKIFENIREDRPLNLNPETAHPFELVLNHAYLDWERGRNVVEPPSFVRGWTSERTLHDTLLPNFQAEVMLSRKQLRTLYDVLNTIQRGYDEKKTGLELFLMIQQTSGITQVNPDALKFGDRFKLPLNLAVLPYKSRILQLTPQEWDAMRGSQEGNNLMQNVAGMLGYYNGLIQDQRESVSDPSPNWKPLALGADPADFVCLLSLHMLP